jgi:hypothetical protein
VFVDATRDLPGVDTGIALSDGEFLTIAPSGSATYGPDPGQCGGNGSPTTYPNGDRSLNGVPCQYKEDPAALVGHEPIGALLVCIGQSGTGCSGQWDGRGYSSETRVYGRGALPGHLFLIYNDIPGQYGNNSGGYQVTVTVRK